MSSRRNPTLDELIAQLREHPVRAQRVEEANTNRKLYGICEADGQITINEPVCLAESIVHEALHDLRPGWSEKTVRLRAANLFFRLKNNDVYRIHRVYERRKRHHRRKRVLREKTN